MATTMKRNWKLLENWINPPIEKPTIVETQDSVRDNTVEETRDTFAQEYIIKKCESANCNIENLQPMLSAFPSCASIKMTSVLFIIIYKISSRKVNHHKITQWKDHYEKSPDWEQ